MTPSHPDSPAVDADAPVAGAAAVPKHWLMAGLVPLVVVIILVAGFAIGGVGPFTRTATTWSAVFLTDNEVFFGHVKSVTKDDITLVNVYYVQSSQKTQTGTAQQSSTQLAVLGLVGNQIQCPQDELTINRDAVLDTQVLQPKSFVVSRLTTLSKTGQTCFTPAPATPAPGASGTPAPAASASPTATATQHTSPSP